MWGKRNRERRIKNRARRLEANVIGIPGVSFNARAKKVTRPQRGRTACPKGNNQKKPSPWQEKSSISLLPEKKGGEGTLSVVASKNPEGKIENSFMVED